MTDRAKLLYDIITNSSTPFELLHHYDKDKWQEAVYRLGEDYQEKIDALQSEIDEMESYEDHYPYNPLDWIDFTGVADMPVGEPLLCKLDGTTRPYQIGYFTENNVGVIGSVHHFDVTILEYCQIKHLIGDDDD